MRNIRPTELRDRLVQPDPPLLLDVREPWEFDSCRIAGSILLPMGQVPAALGELDPARETVVICHHGVRSRSVGYLLERAGFQRVLNLAGGVDAWAREVDPTMRTY